MNDSRLPQRFKLAAEVSKILRQELLNARWEKQLPSERNLSQEFHVSRETIRASLHQLEREGLIERRNRSRRFIAEGVRKKAAPSPVVAMLSPLPFEQWESRILIRTDRLRQYFSNAGIEIVVKSGARFFSSKHHKALEQLVRETKAACWILQGSTKEVQEWFVRHKVPAIVMGQCFDHIALPSIDLDFQSVARHAAGLFLARGHRRIALIVKEPEYAGDYFAAKGWREACLQTSESQPIIIPYDGSICGLQRSLDRTFLSRNPPTAFMAPAKLTLTTVLHLAQRKKIATQDYAFIARDDDPLLDCMIPTVARYRFHPIKLANRLFRETMKIVNQSEGTPRHLSLMPDFVTGESICTTMLSDTNGIKLRKITPKG